MFLKVVSKVAGAVGDRKGRNTREEGWEAVLLLETPC